MDSSTAAPQLEGASEASSTEKAKETSREVQEQALEMDLPTPQPIDETPNYADTEDRSESVKEEDAKKVNKRTRSAKQTASLEVARQARAEKRKKLKESPPDGVGAPDPFLQLVQSELKTWGSTLQESINQRFADFEKRIPYQSPLQDNQVVSSSSNPGPIAAPSASATYMDRRVENQHFPSDFKAHAGDTQFAADMEEIRKYRRRNDAAMQEVMYANTTMETRGQNDPSMGRRPTDRPHFIQW